MVIEMNGPEDEFVPAEPEFIDWQIEEAEVATPEAKVESASKECCTVVRVTSHASDPNKEMALIEAPKGTLKKGEVIITEP